ncbi:MAG: hypothetical protein WCZ86_05785 [Desulfurivibrionaceae bacterium]
MLKECFALLQKIETGIKHKSLVKIIQIEDGLAIESAIVCTKNRQTYVFQRVFSRHEMMNCNEDQLVESFICQVNERFRMAYGDHA